MNEIWNREELYAEIWEKPLVKVAAKYNISAVALGKVCRKLQIPLPGRGHWTKKEFGKTVEQTPLPVAKNLPIVRRMKDLSSNARKADEDHISNDENDPEIMRIVAMKTAVIPVNEQTPSHKTVSQTRSALKQANEDSRGILIRPRGQPTLNIRVSKKMLDRALRLMNAFVLKIESEGFGLFVDRNENKKQTICAQIFNQKVYFSIVERALQKNKREVNEYSWKRFAYDYEPCGMLEFHIGDDSYYRYKCLRDRKTRKLENLLGECLAELMLDARRQRIQAELREREELEERKKEEERQQACEIDQRRRKEGSRAQLVG